MWGSSSSGDIVLLSPGTIIPADGRLLTGHVSSLEVDEALLTGESLPVAKIAEAFSEADIPLGDRLNMVYGGSQVTKGRGKAVIVATGMDTELGKIAEAMERQVKTKETGWRKRWYRFKVALGVAGTSPLQIKLNRLAYLLLSIAILLAIIVLASTAFVDIPESISTVRVWGLLGFGDSVLILFVGRSTVCRRHRRLHLACFPHRSRIPHSRHRKSRIG